MKKKHLLLILLMALLAPWAANAYNYQVQVGNGTSSSYYAPINLYYNYSYSQQIYTAAQINGDCSLPGEIESISFYYAGSVEKTAPITVFMKTTEKTSFSSTSDWETVTAGDIVFEGDWTVSPSGWMTITFAAPFAYDGQSNLVIAINKGYYSSYSSSTNFRYTATTNYQLLYKQNDDNAYDPYAPPTGSRSKNLPNIIFNMTLPYPAPTGLAYENINPNTTTVTWTAPVSSNTVTSYSYQYKKTTETDWSNAEMVNNTSVTLNTLEGITSYNFKVCAIYGNQESCFADINFTTIDPCSAPTEFVANPANITHKSAVISWTPGYDETAWLVKYKKSSEEWTSASEENVNAPNVILSGLESNTTYNVRISPNCDDNKYLSGSFTTKNPCATPTALLITNILADEVTLSWTPGYMETEWTVKYKKSSEEWEAASEENASGSPTITLSGLDKDTDYNVRIYNCETYLSGDFCTADDCPDGKVCIGTGHTTSSYIPTHNYYKYSLTEQIYTPAEIGETGYIMSIDYYKSGTVAMTRNLNIYIVNTNKDEFASNTDWIPVTVSDLVYSGTVTFADNAWTTIELDTPFSVDGTSNIAIVVDDNTGSDVSSANCYVFATAKNQTIYKYNDGTNYDPTNVPSLPSGTLMTKKNRVRLVVGEPPSCAKPIGLAVNYTGGVTATVSWTSEASAWNIDVNGSVTAITDNPYTLTGLELNTEYEVKVQANCDGPTSDWSSSVSFTTDLCMPEDMCEITIALTDSYGDGWNGNHLDVVDKTTSQVLGSYTLGSGSSSGNFNLNVCEGRDINIVYVADGSYQYENGFVVTDINEDVICEHTGGDSSNPPTAGIQATYTVDCTVTTCKKPTNLAKSEVSGHSAKLSWTENGEATAWVVAYKTGSSDFTEVDADTKPFTLTGLDPETEYTVKVKPVCEVDKWSDEITFTTDVACPTPSNIAVTTTPFSAEVSWIGEGEDYDLQYAEIPASKDGGLWLRYDNGINATGIGSSTSGTWTWGVMYPASMLGLNNSLTKVSIYETIDNYTMENYTVKVYSGGDNAPGTLVATETVTPCGADGFNEVTLTEPATIDPTKNVWITVTATGKYVLSACQTTEPNNQWVYDSGSWANIGDLAPSLADYGWMIRGYVEGFNPAAYSWTTKTGVNTPYTITGLTPETTYAVRIKSNCGGDGNSEYSAPKMFTTPSNCTAPYDLEAEPLDESATLSWTGYQDKFNVRYRTAGYYDPIWEDNFENGLNQWTIIAGENAEAVGANAVWYANNPTGGLSFPAYSGDYCASSWSWSNAAYYANNWLITPQLDLQGVVKYYVRTNANYPDKYEVLLSTTTAADTTNFNVTLKAMATAPAVADWTEVIIDLKDYEGQQGYIAIHHLDYNMNYLLIDDFGIYTVTPAGAWTTLNNQDNPVVITTEAGTAYEWQVQGVYAGCDDGVTAWSDMASFTTYNQVYDDEEWSNGETTIDDDVLLIQDVIIPDGVVAYANSITLEPGAHLIIEDGGQLYTNEPVVATVQKELATPSKTAANWYTISSPANNIAPGAVTNLIQGSTDDYDLYLYNEPTTTWLNQKNDANIAMFANLTNGRGYLYWNSTGADLSFTGTLNVDDVNIALTKTGSDALAGFNLIGNPFSHNIYKGTGGAIESTKLAEGFYVLDNTGTWGSVLAYTTPIKPCQGILVQATESFNLTIANSTSSATGEKRSNDDNIMFVVNNSQFEDVTYALFMDEIGLNKINHRNPEAPMIYIPQDGENYAIATMGDDTETFGLNFKAMTTGMYTLSAKADGMFSYLHVIDRLTGEDIDMLVDGKYEFIGSPRDNEARFIVKLSYNANGFDNDEFIYQNGDELIVNGEGELQVYDVMGRYVASYNVNGNKRISAEQFSNAVYIFRLIGSDVKTQKIVVR